MKRSGDQLTVLFNTYPVAFDCPGGGEVQLLKYMEALKKKGVRALPYNPWRPQFDEADIVHFFSVQLGGGYFMDYVKLVKKMPLVLSPIIWIDDPAKYSMDGIRYMLDRADIILPNSREECEQLASVFSLPQNKFIPIVNGVDEVFFNPVSPGLFRSAYQLDGPFVLCMGNVEKRKNQLALFEALADTDIQLVIAGQDREADYAAQCRKAANGRTSFIGKLEHGSELQRSAYAAANALVLPSTLETPGLAALEGAACGCSLAITEVGCTREYFGDFAEYLNPYDRESIRSAVLKALAKPKNPQLSALIRSKYTWDAAADQLIKAYESALAI